MTLQDIFNRVVRHFKRQRWAAANKGTGYCRYRKEENGRLFRCAVGLFIPKNMYKPEMEGKSARNLVPDYIKPETSLGKMLTENRRLFGHLQNVHDQATMTRSDPKTGLYKLLTPAVAKALRDVAEDFGLDASEVDWA